MEPSQTLPSSTHPFFFQNTELRRAVESLDLSHDQPIVQSSVTKKRRLNDASETDLAAQAVASVYAALEVDALSDCSGLNSALVM